MFDANVYIKPLAKRVLISTGGFPISLAALGFQDTLRRFQFYYLDIWNQMITPCRHLNQSDDMHCITQPVEK